MPTPSAFKWAIGVGKKEAVFGTSITLADLTDWFKVKEADFADIQTSFETDDDEINGFIGATEHIVFERKGMVARKCKGTLELLAWLIHMMLGNNVVSGTTPNFTSTVKWRGICDVNPPSFTFLEVLDCVGSTGTWILYKGCIVESFTLEINGKGPAQLSFNLKTDGSETAQPAAIVPAASYAVNKLFGYMLNVKFGPLGTEDISALIRSWKMTVTMGSVEPPSITGGVLVVEQQYGAKNPKLDIEFTLKGDKSSAIYGYYSTAGAPTTIADVKHVASLVVNANRSIVLTNSRGKAVVTSKPQGNETQLNVKFEEEHQATDLGPGVFVCKTGIATFLTASP
jgi:hypothetical protein